jgi:hypothetical protein
MANYNVTTYSAARDLAAAISSTPTTTHIDWIFLEGHRFYLVTH